MISTGNSASEPRGQPLKEENLHSPDQEAHFGNKPGNSAVVWESDPFSGGEDRRERIEETVSGEGVTRGHKKVGEDFFLFEGLTSHFTKLQPSLQKGHRKVYSGTGKLANLKGSGTFTVKAGPVAGEFVLKLEGDYEL